MKRAYQLGYRIMTQRKNLPGGAQTTGSVICAPCIACDKAQVVVGTCVSSCGIGVGNCWCWHHWYWCWQLLAVASAPCCVAWVGSCIVGRSGWSHVLHG